MKLGCPDHICMHCVASPAASCNKTTNNVLHLRLHLLYSIDANSINVICFKYQHFNGTTDQKNLIKITKHVTGALTELALGWNHS